MNRWIVPATPALARRFLRSGRAVGLSELCGPGRIATDLFWARNGIFHGLGMVGLAAGQTVLVPAYICRSVPEAILGYGAEVEFYRIDHRCELDLGDIESRIRPGVSAVLAVHYFGVPQPYMRELRELCDRRGLLLIEDCAHILPSPGRNDGPGRHGHVSVFSWRKFLPVYDGATLSVASSVMRHRASLARAPFPLQLRSAKDVVDRWRAFGPASPAHSGTRTGHSLQTIALVVEEREPRRVVERPVSLAAVDPNGDSFLPDATALPMTWTSRAIRNQSDLAAISEVRRSHWQALFEATRDQRGLQPLYGELDVCCSPWIFPLRFIGVPEAHVLLRKRGIPAASWGGVRPLTLPDGVHHESDRLFREIVFLPVHQGLTDAAIRVIATAVQEIASS